MKHTRLFRSIAFLLALTLLPAPAHAVEQIYFTAVNITIMPLTADTMPVWIDGVLYVPYTVFDDHSNGAPQWMNLGAYGSYNTTKQTVSLYNRQGTMMFDLVEDTCYDLNSGRTYPSPAITRNKIPFVPVGQVCSFLGLTYSYLTVPQGILVRIKSSSNSLSDADLIDTGKDTLNNRLWEYNNQNSAYTPPATDSPPLPPENNSPETIPLYLGVRCERGGSAAALVNSFDAQSVRGLFFFSPEQLEAQDDLVRRLLATGHSVGLLLNGGTLDESREQLARGEGILREMACVRPSALLCPEDQRKPLEEEGWVCWRETASVRPGVSAQEQARSLRNQELVRLTLDDSTETASITGSLLYQLKNRQFDIRIPMETRL